MIRAIIVEDDPKHYKTLTQKLQEAQEEVSVEAVAGNVSDAEKAIRKHQPDLIFLDIDLEAGDNGFDLLRRFDKPDFAVIFTTQHNSTDNAIAAIRACALDFLPKPVELPDLNNALARYNPSDSVQQVQTLKNNIGSNYNEWVKAIWLSGTEGRTRIKADNIIYCKSNNTYTAFHLSHPVEKKTLHTSSQPIKHWEHSLLHSDIMRVHNEYLVNLSGVEKYKSRMSGSASLMLSGGIEIPVSKSRKNDVKSRLDLYKKR